jgi:hypothetical protein
MPLDVTITTDEDVFEFVVQNDQTIQPFSFTVTGEVQSVELDRENWVLNKAFEMIVDVPEQVVSRPQLLPNHPNPFNPSTTIQFDLPASGGLVRLQVFDVTGRLVRTLVSEPLGSGRHSVDWDGRDSRGQLVGSGTYFARLRTEGWEETQKMSLLK